MVTREDSGGIATSPPSTTSVTVASSSYGKFYTDGTCGTSTTTYTIASGASTVNTYFSSSVVESQTLTASGLTVNGTQAMAVTGPFATPVSISRATSGLPAGPPYYTFASGDFDLDGNPDIAVSEGGTTTVKIAWGNGAGSFSSGPSLTVGNNASGIFVTSLRNNGIQDLIVANYSAPAGNANLSVILGNGNRTFAATSNYNGTGAKTVATRPTAGVNLVNTSGYVDVVLDYTGNGGANTGGIDVFPGNGTGTLGAPTYNYAAAAGVSFGGTVVTGDLNNDTNNDIIAPMPANGAGNAMWFKSTGAGSFTPRIMNPGGPNFGNTFAFADFNSDGILDWALGLSYHGDFVSIGNGTVTPASTPVNGTWINNVGQVRALTGIFTSSGFIDAAFVGDEATSVLYNGLTIFPGNGNGTFKTNIIYHFSVESVMDGVTGDFNVDGKMDVLLLGLSGTLYFLAGQ